MASSKKPILLIITALIGLGVGSVMLALTLQEYFLLQNNLNLANGQGIVLSGSAINGLTNSTYVLMASSSPVIVLSAILLYRIVRKYGKRRGRRAVSYLTVHMLHPRHNR